MTSGTFTIGHVRRRASAITPIAAVGLAALMIAATAACAHKTAQAPAPMSEAAAEQAAAAAQAAASKNVNEPTNAIPAGFPKVLLFPGATVQHVRKPKGSLREILLSTDASLDDLVKFYQATLKRNGFDVTSTLKLAARGTFESDFSFHGRQGSVMLYPASKGSKAMVVDLIFEQPAKINPMFAVPVEKWDVIGPGEVAQNNSRQNEKRN